jgi:hypothetical protein
LIKKTRHKHLLTIEKCISLAKTNTGLKWKDEKDILNKLSPKPHRCSNTNIWQRKLQIKSCQRRQRRSLHIDKENYVSIIYKNYKYVCAKHHITHFIKQTLLDIKAQIGLRTIIVCDLDNHHTNR